MSECYNFSASMTGSTNLGPLQPQENSSPLPSQPSPFERPPIVIANNSARRDRSQSRRKMTPIPPNSQQIQLTPLWEHVVRTRRFPPEIDTRLTFVEISERLRDPEWEVRQHALRVLMDVLPTLNADVVDKVMQPVVPELVNNLGHPAPAVRKGALDTLRVYLVHSENRDEMIKAILQDGLNRSEGRDAYQTNVITGVILSAPSILFPSAKSFRPTVQALKETTTALASRLGQVPHQEAVVKSLMKIRGIVGPEEFDGYLADHDESLRRNIEILSKVYNVKPSGRAQSRNSFDESVKDKNDGRIGNNGDFCLDRTWDSDSDTSGIAEEDDEAVNGSNGGGMPGARVVLETEIKFNEETAITMTILEEKDDDEDEDETDNEEDNEDEEQDDESGTDVRNEAEMVGVADNLANEKRKTPRRVHFGGEVVKLRTPDSDDTETTEVVSQKTRIPLPVSPATKMPGESHRRRPSSQPCSPHLGKRRVRRASRSASNSPKREFHTHSADLSPTKGILTRTSSPVPTAEVQKDVAEVADLPNESQTAEKDEKKNPEAEVASDEKREDPSEVPETEASKNVQTPASTDVKATEDSTMDASPAADESDEQVPSESTAPPSKRKSDSKAQTSSAKSVDEKSSARVSRGSARGRGRNFEAFPRQERNYILMELSSPERKAFKEKASESEAKAAPSDSQNRQDKSPVTVDPSRVPVGESIVAEKVEGYRDGWQVSSPTGGGMICASATSGADRSAATAEARFDSSRDRGSARCVVDDRGRERYPGRTSIRNERDNEHEASVEGSGSVTCSSSEGESNPQEPSWEELGLVGQDVLEDLHNKDDWRARVRGLERVASAMRTSSALIAIEPRLGSLLHAVLGCERSCRVAAAGLAVAKVVVAGVTEDALKRRLPQLAWGLARQGGPNAAQLARIAMLRLRPALFLEQLLQPQCLGAKNAKTRENALQLLIFSLVTFPSTEFKVQTVAHKVASMVADRRRRVRQAALDTLAVLAQIYESEEVLKAGKKAAAGRHDKEAMICAIRARLSRKSLPLVSADGLVVYGLQISPAVQIATGPDVDWIVAGSGSVSPGTGRTRGQIIATTGRSERGRLVRNENAKHRDNPWTERANLVALGVGLRSDGEQPMAWQIVPEQRGDEPRCSDNLRPSDDGEIDPEIHNGRYSDSSLRLEDQLQMYHGHESDLANYQEMIEANLDNRTNSRSIQRSREKLQNHKGTSTFPQEVGSLRLESRIPVLFLRERPSDTNLAGHQTPNYRNRSTNMDFGMRRRKSKDFDANGNSVHSREERDGSYASWLQRRKRMQQDMPVDSIANPLMNQSFEPHYGSYRSMSRPRNERFAVDDRSPLRSDGHASRSPSNFAEERQRPLFRNPPQQGYSTFETYGMACQRHRRVAEGQSIRGLRTAPEPLAGNYQQYPDIPGPGAQMTREHMTRDAASQMSNIEQVSSHAQTTGGFISRKRTESPFRRRLRSLSPSQLYHQRQFIRLDSNESHAVSMYAIDKAAVNEEEYNERNRQHYSNQEDAYQIHSINKERTEYQGEIHVKSANSVLDLSRSNRQQKAVQSAICQRSYGNNSRSSTPQSRDADKAFDVITQTASSQDHDIVDSYIIPLGTPKLETAVGSANTSTEEDTAKDWSSEEEVKVKSRLGHLVDDVFGSIEENDNESVDSGDLMIESDEMTERRRRASSIISSERIFSNEPLEDSTESVHSNQSSNNDVQSISSAKMLDSPKLESVNSDDSPGQDSKSVGTPDSPEQIPSSSCSPRKSPSLEDETCSNSNEERIDSSNLQNDNASVQSPDIESRRASIKRDSPAIVIASRPHSTEANSIVEGSENAESDVTQTITDSTQISTEESSTIDTAEAETARELAFSMIPLVADGLAILNDKDSGSETNAEPGILKIEPTTPPATNDPVRKMPSKVPRSTARFRANSLKSSSDQSTERNTSKPKPVVQQCFTQLESKDWEVALKGLKALSQLTKQHPEYLDACAAGTIGRLLSRHIKSLRSQVSRAACLASGDIFSSQIRGIDQELDDIASSLLHRTADTNRFLRADSNAALDRMAEHLPPQKIIGIIVHRGANHQNAIVRAATGRLLSNIVERVGPDQTMNLPRDVRDKLLNTGAKLLIDGSLDARNHAKKMFRRLTICEGFQRALVDAVPDTTLRHIDKTLKSL